MSQLKQRICEINDFLCYNITWCFQFGLGNDIMLPNYMATFFRTQKVQTGRCRYCGEGDTAKHTIFECKRWVRSRRECFLKLGNLTRNNLVDMMLERTEQWSLVFGSVRGMSRKSIESRQDYLDLDAAQENKRVQAEIVRQELLRPLLG